MQEMEEKCANGEVGNPKYSKGSCAHLCKLTNQLLRFVSEHTSHFVGLDIAFSLKGSHQGIGTYSFQHRSIEAASVVTFLVT
jgi:hypothetical protein